MMNQQDDALSYYEKTVAIDPFFAEAFRSLSKVKKFKINDPQINHMQSLYSRKDLKLSWLSLLARWF